MNSLDKAYAPSFIISCERSGSTLLRYLIDTHPLLASPGELGLGNLARELAEVVKRTLGQVEPQRAAQIALMETRTIIDGIMTRYAQARGKATWCEKAPVNVHHLSVLRAVYPDARYICLYRNAPDVVFSCLETMRYGQIMRELREYMRLCPQSPVSAMVVSWTDKTSKILAFENENKEICHRICYEDLVARPDEVLPPLFDFLGVEWIPHIVKDAMHKTHDMGGGDCKICTTKRIEKDRVGRGNLIDFKGLSAERLARMNALLDELDYPLITSESAQDAAL